MAAEIRWSMAPRVYHIPPCDRLPLYYTLPCTRCAALLMVCTQSFSDATFSSDGESRTSPRGPAITAQLPPASLLRYTSFLSHECFLQDDTAIVDSRTTLRLHRP